MTPLNGSAITGTFDALGRLVETVAGSTHVDFVYGSDGSKIAAVKNGALVKGLVLLPGGETAVYNSSGLNFIRHTDWLGSSHPPTTWTHGLYSKEAYAPFGEVYDEAGTADRSFTGQDQDTVTGSPATGIYDFLFRKFDPAAGRWLSPDPAGWGAVDLRNPQTLNRYSYTLGEPEISVDPDGRLSVCWSVSFWVDGEAAGRDDGCIYLGDLGAGIGIPSALPLNLSMAGHASNNNTPKQTQQAPQPKEQPWYCGAGNYWSHPFTAPTGKQWGEWSVADAGVAWAIGQKTGGKDPFSRAFAIASFLEGWGWATCP